MATKRSPNRDRAFKLWRKSGGTIKLKELAEQIGVSAGLIRKWKNIDGWDERMNGNVTNDGNTNNGNVTDRNNGKFTQGNKEAAGFGAPLGNDNAVGNCGGAPHGNQNALKHGFYSKYIPPEDLEMFEEMPGAGSLENDLRFARYKLLNLQRCQIQQKKRMIGVAIGPDGPTKYDLQDDFYENMIQKQLKVISELEFKIHKMQGANGADNNNVEIIDNLEVINHADKT